SAAIEFPVDSLWAGSRAGRPVDRFDRANRVQRLQRRRRTRSRGARRLCGSIMTAACIRFVPLLAAIAFVTATPALANGAADGNAGLSALNSGRYGEAVRLFSRALSDNRLSSDDREFAYYNRADAYAKLGDEQRAVADLDQAMRLKP